MSSMFAEWQREAWVKEDIYSTELPAVPLMQSRYSEKKVARDRMCMTSELSNRLQALLVGKLGHK